VTSPIDGVVTVVKVTEGAMASRGQPIARVFDPRDLWIRFAVPPEGRDAIHEGDAITAVPLHGTAPLPAVVRIVNRALEPPLELSVVEADLDDASVANHDAMLGTLVDVRL
jgi:hypothetical protein